MTRPSPAFRGGRAGGARLVRGVLLCAALAPVWPSPVQAQAPRDLTVEESVRMGLEYNARLRAALADVDAARASRRLVDAARLPAVRSQASYTRLSGNIPSVEFTLPGFDSVFTFQGVQLDRLNSELSLELPLLTQLRLGHESRAAGHDAVAAELTLEQERSDVAFEIRRAYWNLRRALDLRSVVETALAGVEEHLGVVRQRVEHGAALARDLLAAQTRRSEVLLQQVEAANAVRLGELELNRLIGLPLDSPLRPVSMPDAAPVPPAPDMGVGSLSAAALEDRPRIAALNRQVLGLRERLGAAEASRLPEVDFVGRYLYSRPNPYFFTEQDRFRSSWELGISGRWAIWEGGRRSAQEREARARVEAAEARLQETSELVAVETARRQLEVRRAAEAVDVAEQNVREAEESFRVVREQFGEGMALSADVLDAEEALRQARASRAAALADHAIADAAVLNALGRVW